MFESEHSCSSKSLLLIPVLLVLVAIALNFPELRRYLHIERM
jgi:hypothetical protein